MKNFPLFSYVHVKQNPPNLAPSFSWNLKKIHKGGRNGFSFPFKGTWELQLARKDNKIGKDPLQDMQRSSWLLPLLLMLEQSIFKIIYCRDKEGTGKLLRREEAISYKIRHIQSLGCRAVRQKFLFTLPWKTWSPMHLSLHYSMSRI